MSVRTWMDEYMPMPMPKSVVKGLEWSLRKWQGLRPDALAEHSVRRTRNLLHGADGGRCLIGGSNCPQCRQTSSGSCDGCPLKIGRETCGEAFGEWLTSDNPEPMIARIEKAISGIKP